MQLPEQIESARLRLRPWRFADLADLLGYARDPEWGRFLPVPRPYTEEDGRSFIAECVLCDPAVRRAWAIERDERVVGGIDLTLAASARTGVLGYAVARQSWGRGLATEAARAVISAAFDPPSSLTRIEAMVDPRNAASIRLLEKLGMLGEGLLRDSAMLRGDPTDALCFGILRSEWLDLRAKPLA